MDQETNRKEDGTIIGLGYAVNAPMTRNNEPMSFFIIKEMSMDWLVEIMETYKIPIKPLINQEQRILQQKQYEELLKNQEKRDQQLNVLLNPLKNELQREALVEEIFNGTGRKREESEKVAKGFLKRIFNDIRYYIKILFF